MPNEQRHADQRTPAVATRAVMFAAMGFLAFVGISLVVLHIYLSATESARRSSCRRRSFAKPRLQTNDTGDLAKLQAEQRGRLDRYTWVDREKGIAAIPIEEAMKRGRGAWRRCLCADRLEQSG